MTQNASSGSPLGPDLRAALVAMVRKRVPESDVEDIVQATLIEAVSSPHAPKESDALRRWLFGVAKNKVVDFHRRRGRESFDLPEIEGSPAPHQEADLLRWAEKNLPQGEDAQKTLDWMLREGEGEKLESIAESEQVPAPRVRQRVSRLRRHLKDNWQKEVALLAAVGVIIGIVLFYLKNKDDEQIIVHDPNVIPLDPRAEQLRKDGLDLCAKSDWPSCIEKLDDAKRLDPAGDTRPEVKKARDDAAKAKEIENAPPPSPEPSTSDNITPPPTKVAPPSSATPFPPSPKPANTTPPPAVPKGGGKQSSLGPDFGSDMSAKDLKAAEVKKAEGKKKAAAPVGKPGVSKPTSDWAGGSL
jgi:RNA polymerase sigma factor (sigma-70 family)